MRRRLGLLAVATLAALLLAEATARLAFGAYATSIYVLDDACLHRLAPGARRLYVHEAVNGGASIEVAVDAHGYRGPERSGRRPRVAVFGDSFVMAEFSAVEDTFVERLAAELGGEGVNAGVAGYGPDQCLVRLQRELTELAPDLLVVCIFAGNDFGDLLRNKLFRLDGAGQLERTGAVIGDTLRREFADARDAPMLARLARRVWRRWRDTESWTTLRGADDATRRAFAQRMPEQWLAECAAEYREFVELGDLTVRNLLRDHDDADVALEPDGAAARYKVALLRAVMAKIAAVAEAAAVPLCFVAIPSAVDVCDAYEAGQVDVARFPGYRRERLTEIVAGLARELGVPVVDLFPTFREGGRDALYFRPPDGHWNDAAQALAAAVVAACVRQR